MDVEVKVMKKCKYCEMEKPLSQFYESRKNGYTSRCRSCHGVASRKCVICGKEFVGKSRKTCGDACHKKLRPVTFLTCHYCEREYGPVNRLNRKFCSLKCKNKAQATGRKTYRKTLTKARSAQSLLRYHVLAGHIVRPSVCEECGANNRAIEAAHYNYDEPLRVRWLCRSCHRRWDKRDPKHATVIVHRRREDLHPFAERHNPDKKQKDG